MLQENRRRVLDQKRQLAAVTCAALIVGLSYVGYAVQSPVRGWDASAYDPADYRIVAEHFWGVSSSPSTYRQEWRGDWAAYLRTVPFRDIGPGTLYLLAGFLRTGKMPLEQPEVLASGRALATVLKLSLAAALLLLFVIVYRRWGTASAFVALVVTAFPPQYWRTTDDLLAEPIERVLFVLLMACAVAVRWRRPSVAPAFAMVGLLWLAAQLKSQWLIAALLILPLLLAQFRASRTGVRRTLLLCLVTGVIPLGLVLVHWVGWRTTSLCPGVALHVHLKYGGEVLSGFCGGPHHSFEPPAFCDPARQRREWWNLSFGGGTSLHEYEAFDRYARRYVLGHPLRTLGAFWEGLTLASSLPGIERAEVRRLRLLPLGSPWRTMVRWLDVTVWMLLVLGLRFPQTRIPCATVLTLWIVPAAGNVFSIYELRYHVPMAGLAPLVAYLAAREASERVRSRWVRVVAAKRTAARLV